MIAKVSLYVYYLHLLFILIQVKIERKSITIISLIFFPSIKTCH